MARTETTTRDRPAAAQQQAKPAPAGNLPAAQAEPKRVHPLVAFRDYATERVETLNASLPKHISADVFLSIVMTALQKKPDLLKCTQQSLWNACVMAAQDGLLPDGREGAIAPYGQNADGKRVAEIATWMPMVEGLRKKARNSGEILNWEVHAVRARDHFRFALGDDAFIEHEPYFGSEDPGEILGVYSIATLKDGIKSRDVMTTRDVKKIEAKSSAKNGPWKDPTFWGEMAKKTIARRHYKQLPHSAALDRLIARDDTEFDLDHQADEQIEQRSHRRLMSTTAAFDRFASPAAVIDHDPQTGEAVDEDFGGDDQQEEQAQDAKPAPAADRQPKEAMPAKPKPAEVEKPKPQAKAEPKPEPAPEPEQEVLPPEGSEASGPVDDMTDGSGEDDAAPGVGDDVRRWPNGAVPSNADEYESYAETKIGDFSVAGEVAPWWKSAPEIKLRKDCGVPQEMFERIRGKAQTRVGELSRK